MSGQTVDKHQPEEQKQTKTRPVLLLTAELSMLGEVFNTYSTGLLHMLLSS